MPIVAGFPSAPRSCGGTSVRPATSTWAATAILDSDPNNGAAVQAQETGGFTGVLSPYGDVPTLPRAVALTDGVVAAYRTNIGQTVLGSLGTQLKMTPIGPFDLVATDNQAVLVWAESAGLRLTRVCP